MMKNIFLNFIFISSLAQLGCSGSANSGSTPAPTSSTTTDLNDTAPAPGQTSPGNGSVTPPIIEMLNLKGGNYLAGGSNFKIRFKVTDTVLGFNQVLVQACKHTVTTLGQTFLASECLPLNCVLVNGKNSCSNIVLTTSEIPAELNWNIDKTKFSGTGYFLRIIALGSQGSSAEVYSDSAFTIDSDSPRLGNMTLSNIDLSATNGFVQFNLLDVQDSTSPLADICVKKINSTPTETDTCWSPISNFASTINTTADPTSLGKAYTSITIPYFIGFYSTTSLQFYVWARDKAKTITCKASGTSCATVSVNSTTENGTEVTTLYDDNSPATFSAAQSRIAVNYPATKNSYVAATGTTLSFSYDFSGADSNSNNFTDINSSYADQTSTMSNPNIFTINRQGQAYFIDVTGQKIYQLNMNAVSAGSLSVFADTSTTLGGTSYKLKGPLKIAADLEGNLWVLDKDGTNMRILRLTKSKTLLDMIGGGSNATDDNVANAADLQLSYDPSILKFGTFVPLPEGRILFSSEHHNRKLKESSGVSFRLRQYDPALTTKISSISFAGSFNNSGTTAYASTMKPFSNIGVTYDFANNQIKNFFVRLCPATVTGECGTPVLLRFSSLGSDPVKLTTPSSTGSNAPLFSDLISLYNLNSRMGQIAQLNQTTNSWSSLAGDGTKGTSFCANGISANACSFSLADAQVGPGDKLFYLESIGTRFIIRTIEIDGVIHSIYDSAEN